MIPFLEKMTARLNRRFHDVVADMGYASEENYTYLENNRIHEAGFLIWIFSLSSRQILFQYHSREHAFARAVEDIDNNVIAVILRIELKAEHLAAAGDRISDRGTA